MSGKGAKRRTRGRKLHSTGTKARMGRTRRPRADLERQLEAYGREIDHARDRLIEAMKRQTATSEVLRIISNSPTEIQTVPDAVAENAANKTSFVLADSAVPVDLRLMKFNASNIPESKRESSTNASPIKPHQINLQLRPSRASTRRMRARTPLELGGLYPIEAWGLIVL